MMRMIKDGIINLQTRLGGARDKGANATYHFVPIQDHEIDAAYRSSWIIRKAINIPVDDATRKWRKFTDADGKVLEDISDLERAFAVRKKTRQTKINARLFGGAAILMGVKGQENLEEPLDPNRVSKGDLVFVTRLERHNLAEMDPVLDPRSPRYGRPIFYEVTTGNGVTLRVHYSHIIEMEGEQKPSSDGGRDISVDHWGDSLMQTLMRPLQNVDSVMSNMSSLVSDAKTDVIKIPNLSQNIANPEYEKNLQARFETARMVKGNHGVLILDANEEYQSVIYGLEGLPPASQAFLQVASAAADVPMTRFLGQSPGGLNSTGESDLTNYYDAVQSMQQNEIQPAMQVFDQVLIRSAGHDPAKVKTIWEPLKQMDEAQTADLQSKVATMISSLASTEIFSDTQIEAIAIEAMGKVGLKGLRADNRTEEGGDDAGA